MGPICFEFTNYPRTNNHKWLSQSLMTPPDKLRFSNVFSTLITFVYLLRYQKKTFLLPLFSVQNISGLFSSRIQWGRVGWVQLHRSDEEKWRGATLHPNFQIRQNCTKFLSQNCTFEFEYLIWNIPILKFGNIRINGCHFAIKL